MSENPDLPEQQENQEAPGNQEEVVADVEPAEAGADQANQEEPATARQEPAATSEEPVAVSDEPAAVAEEAAAVPEEAAAVPEEPAAVSEEAAAAAPEEAAAVPEEAAAAPEEAMAAPEEPAAVSEEAAAAPEEPAAVSEEAAAAPEEPAAAPEEAAAPAEPEPEGAAAESTADPAVSGQPDAEEQGAEQAAAEAEVSADHQAEAPPAEAAANQNETEDAELADTQPAADSFRPEQHDDPEAQARAHADHEETVAAENTMATLMRPSAKSVKIQEEPVQFSHSDLMQPAHNGSDQVVSVASRQAVNITMDAKKQQQQQKKQATETQQMDPVYQDLMKDSVERETRNALNLVWSFGFGSVVPVLNLSTPKRKQVLYTSSHIGIIYDFRYNKQRILEGHNNVLTCTCASFDKRWIATGDSGHDSAVIVWDSNSCSPVRTIFDPHPNGVVAIALTPDAKYLATLSATIPQTFAIWDWTTGSEEPLCSCVLSESFGVQNYILFDPADASNVITNSEKQVIFYSWKNDSVHYFAPPLTDKDFNKPVGKFSQTIFYQATQALTVTSLGNLVVWSLNEMSKADQPSLANKKPLKILKIQDRCITNITTCADYIVTADVLGHVKFFDQSLRLIFWLQDFQVGPINSVSFSYDPSFYQMLKKKEVSPEYPADTTIPAAPFPFADFVIGSTSATCGHLTAATRKLELIRKEHNSAVNAIAVHREEPLIAIAGITGLLQLWNYDTKLIIASRVFEQCGEITCLMYDQECAYLMVGFSNSTVRVLDATTLQDELADPFSFAKAPITHITFSHDNVYLATADAAHTITLYKRHNPGEMWQYMCRYRTHCKTIRDLLAGVHIDTNKPRLLSIGEDRMLIEYDLENSTVDNLRILARQRFEQSAVPLCMTWYPPVYKEQFLCTANNQLKLKLYNAVTKMCRKTILGPCFGSCLQKMAVLNTQDDADIPRDKFYLAYITDDKVGLHALPADGNPYRCTSALCHPNGVANMVCSYDGKYIFTAGANDGNVHMYKVCVDMLEAQMKLGGEGLTPFYDLVEGGRYGPFYGELENYFYYAQLRSQGINTMEPRKVTKTIPLSEVPFVMRAIGFYPSEQEIEDIVNEVKFSRYVETGQTVEELDLGDLVKLYINHRPVFGVQMQRIRQAFAMLGYSNDEASEVGGPSPPASARNHVIQREMLMEMLQKRGEHMSEAELAEYLVTLLGFNAEGGRSELQIIDPADAEETLNNYLPAEVTAEVFAKEVLGIPQEGVAPTPQKQSTSQKLDAEVSVAL